MPGVTRLFAHPNDAANAASQVRIAGNKYARTDAFCGSSLFLLRKLKTTPEIATKGTPKKAIPRKANPTPSLPGLLLTKLCNTPAIMTAIIGLIINKNF